MIARPIDQSKFGVNGTFNRGLGCVVNSWKEYDAICEAKGLVPLSSLPTHTFEDMLEARINFQESEEKEFHAWEDCMNKEGVHTAVEGTKDYIERWERVWDTMAPAHEILESSPVEISTT